MEEELDLFKRDTGPRGISRTPAKERSTVPRRCSTTRAGDGRDVA